MARWTAADVRKLTGQAVPKGTCPQCERIVRGRPRP